ncbi:MAG TPA: tetratricopeptide repeat protein [Flavobacterium sp.]|uniref:tetratricopeptide repeat protein n=1 Tax=Flavobacterium sp. TaxID=239 RepID=UPI002C712E66|nr:tetratricopeptide repeat protein [Flavobacterium sp.]HNP32431.1 tetratricopeptide repeat protein [Flavobacterium sp.]
MRIKQIVLASAVLVSVSAFAQKDELKVLKKIYAKDIPTTNDMVEYKANVAKLSTLATEEGDKIYANFYKAMLPVLEVNSFGATVTPDQIANTYNLKAITDLAAALNATLDYEKKTGKKLYTDDINETINTTKPTLVNIAVGLGDNKKFKEASDVLYAVYLLDKKDTDKLFYAASYSVNGLDYDKALDYYNQLKALNYSGEGTVYWATNKTSKKEETFASKEERALFIKTGTHEKPRDEKIESKKGEIYKNIALILVEKGKIDDAKAAIAEAKKENPNDSSLILTEADLYLKINDTATYAKLVNEAIAKDPNNPDLYYNLGVVNGNLNKLDEAEKYYKKALEIDPNYFNANLNLAELKLRADEKFVNEMNKLGTSEKDNKRYEVIKAEREKNFKAALPYLEKAVELKGDNESAKKTLLSVYNALEMTDKYKALKAKM